MINAQLSLILVLIFVMSAGAAYVKGRYDGSEVAAADYLQDIEIARTARDAAISAAAGEIAKIDIEYTTIKSEVVRDIIEKPVYRDCIHDADSLRRINRASGYPDWQPPNKSTVPVASSTSP